MIHMGIIEKSVRREARRTKINRAVISIIALAGILAIGAVAPNVLGAMGKVGLIGSRKRKQNVQKSFARLVQNGYIL
jgi:hypothetical protein